MVTTSDYKNSMKDQNKTKNPRINKMINFKKILFKAKNTKIGMKSKMN